MITKKNKEKGRIYAKEKDGKEKDRKNNQVGRIDAK